MKKLILVISLLLLLSGCKNGEYIDNIEKIYSINGTILAINSNKELLVWGESLPFMDDDNDISKPLKLLDDAKEVACLGRYLVVTTNEDEAYLWNNNIESKESDPIILTDVKQVDCGTVNVGILKNDKSLTIYGSNSLGAFGNGTTIQDTSSNVVFDDVSDFEIYANQFYALRDDNSVYAWGYFVDKTQDKPDMMLSTPIKVETNVLSMKYENNQLYVIKDDHSLWVWGKYIDTAILPDTSNIHLTKIEEDVKEVIPSGGKTFIIKNDNSLWGIGDNSTGELGKSTTEIGYSSKLIKIMDSIKNIDNLGRRTYITKNDNSLWASSNDGYIKVIDSSNNGNYHISAIPCVSSDYILTGDNILYMREHNTKSLTKISEDIKMFHTNCFDSDNSRPKSYLLASKKNGELFGIGANQVSQLGIGEEEIHQFVRLQFKK